MYLREGIYGIQNMRPKAPLTLAVLGRLVTMKASMQSCMMICPTWFCNLEDF